MELYEFGARVGLIYVPMLFSLCFHEYAHGVMAKWRGDNTADRMGRLNMNPMSHADMVGTFILPLSMLYFGGPIIGWGKPVPVDERNLKNPQKDIFWVALAGPLSNVGLAIIGSFFAAFFMVVLPEQSLSGALQTFFYAFVRINLFLAVFNLIPLHPLDGGKVLARFLPRAINERLEEYQHISGLILMALMFMGLLSFLFYPIEGLSFVLIALFKALLGVVA